MIENITRCILMIDEFVDSDHPQIMEVRQLIFDIKKCIMKKKNNEYQYLLPLLDLRVAQIDLKYDSNNRCHNLSS